MKPVEYYAFWYQHRVDLKEYLGKFHGLQFSLVNQRYVCSSQLNISIPKSGAFENTWYDSNSTPGTKTQYGINLDHGNILDWECIKHDCPPVEAVPIVSKRSAKLSAFKTSEYKRLVRIFKLIADRYRIILPTPVENYLDYRGIDYRSIKSVFNLGSPIPYQVLFNYLNTMGLAAHELTSLLTKLFINARPNNYREIPRDLSTVVPVYDKDNNYIGFHGRRINPGSKSKYFNTGYLKDFIGDVLFGEERRDVQAEIQAKKQAILTKGLFDFLTCYQENNKQVLATLNQGISAAQFDQIMKMSIDEIIVGFESRRERSNITGLMHSSLKQVKLSVPQTDRDIDAEIAESQITLDQLLASAKQTVKADNKAKRIAALRRRDYQLKSWKEMGQTFVIRKDQLNNELQTSKGTHRVLKNFLHDKASENIQVLPGNTPYVRFPKTFVTDEILSKFKSELRTLLLLLTKSYPNSGTINYTNDVLHKELNISESQLIEHKNRLMKNGYLLEKKNIKARKTSSKGRFIRKVNITYYPTTIKFILEPPDESEKD